MKFSILISALTFACLSGTVNAQTDACAGEAYCVKLDPDTPITAGLGGTTGNAVTITYDATDSAQAELYYKTSVMKVDAGACTEVVTDAVALAAGIGNSGVDTESVGKLLTVVYGLDASGIESNPDFSTVSGSTVTVTFCAKVDLVYHSPPDFDEDPLATSKTIITMTIDKEKDFSIDVTGTAETAVDKSAVVSVDYDLESCICQNDGTCYTSGADPAKKPGDSFNYCVKTTAASEAQVVALKDVEFINEYPGASGIKVPILSSTGDGVGPAGNPTCADKDTDPGVGCQGAAVTFAKMYEADIGGALTDISGSVKISGVAVLGFKTRRRLGASIVEETKLVEVPFGKNKSRDLQEDDVAPANEFDMNVQMASPPDRSANSAASTTSKMIGFVSMMVVGLFF